MLVTRGVESGEAWEAWQLLLFQANASSSSNKYPSHRRRWPQLTHYYQDAVGWLPSRRRPQRAWPPRGWWESQPACQWAGRRKEHDEKRKRRRRRSARSAAGRGCARGAKGKGSCSSSCRRRRPAGPGRRPRTWPPDTLPGTVLLTISPYSLVVVEQHYNFFLSSCYICLCIAGCPPSGPTATAAPPLAPALPAAAPAQSLRHHHPLLLLCNLITFPSIQPLPPRVCFLILTSQIKCFSHKAAHELNHQTPYTHKNQYYIYSLCMFIVYMQSAEVFQVIHAALDISNSFHMHICLQNKMYKQDAQRYIPII